MTSLTYNSLAIVSQPVVMPAATMASSDWQYAQSLFAEGLGIADPVIRANHLSQVRDLVGSTSVFHALEAQVVGNSPSIVTAQSAQREARAVVGANGMQTRGYGYRAVDFGIQSADSTRAGIFTYAEDVAHDSIAENQRKTTEVEGLVELQGFLDRFLTQTRTADGSFKYPKLAEQAKSIQDNLTFIGEKEYDEAVVGLKHVWTSYLEQNPSNQLCVVAGISNSEKYADRKSDDFLRDRILSTLSDDELQKYSGRIVGNVHDLSVEPANASVVLLDDWAITGSQLRREYAGLTQDPVFQRFNKGGSVKINLLVSSQERIQQGLDMDLSQPNHDVLPVEAYFQAHPTDPEVTSEFGGSHISGLHSTVNYGFGKSINSGMVKVLGKLGKLRKGELPVALANIVRPYKSEPTQVLITPTSLRRTMNG